jgi:ADP-ribosylglycohydrolase
MVLGVLAKAAENPDPSIDPCDYTGEGWIAEEALATALLCFLLFRDDPHAALRRAARTRGDSDSIAALAGAFAGAALGVEAFPSGWRERIEYADRLEAVATGLADASA